MARGGYRQPSNPAPVSGPGALSERTDGGATEGMTQPQQNYTGFAYGQNKGLAEQQSGAPMAGNPYPMAGITQLGAPTQRPDEPITTGINYGEGAGTEAMRGMPNQTPSLIDTIKHLTQFDASGDAELIYRSLLDSGY
jgi:hypothetical protein